MEITSFLLHGNLEHCLQQLQGRIIASDGRGISQAQSDRAYVEPECLDFI